MPRPNVQFPRRARDDAPFPVASESKGGITHTVAILASATCHRSTSRGATDKPLEYQAITRPRKRGNSTKEGSAKKCGAVSDSCGCMAT